MTIWPRSCIAAKSASFPFPHAARSTITYDRIRRRGTLASPRNRQIAILHGSVIPLQHDRSRRAFIAVERAARDPGDRRATDHIAPIEGHRHRPADQRDVVGLPFAGALRGVLIGHEESVDGAEAA